MGKSFSQRLRQSLVFVCFYCVLLAPLSGAFASSVVAEKNINDAALNPPPPPPKKKGGPQVGYKNGFFIKSADGNYKLLIGSYFQFHFHLLNEGGETEYGFRMRRARLYFKGNAFSPRLKYKIQLDLVNFQTDLLLDAYINYEIIQNDLLNIQVGQQSIPYIRQQAISSTAQMFVDRALASREFVNDDDVDTDGDGVPDSLIKHGRDLGVQFHGQPFDKKLEYYAGVFNGHGMNTTNVNNDFLYMGRVVYNPMGYAGYSYEGDYSYHEDFALFVGVSANYNVRNISSDKVTSLGGETGLKYKGFSATGEFLFRNTKPGDTLLDTTNDIGYYAQAGYFVLPKKMEVAVRASQVFFEGPLNDRGEFQVGVNGFVYGNNLKLQTDYSYLPTNTVGGLENNHRYRLRLQTIF